jgi:predicted nucleic-acid-binding protein
MIALDTNVLVRYLAQDDARQSAAATRLVERQLSAAEPGFVSLVTICETACMLSRAYDLPPEKLREVILALAQSKQLMLQDQELVLAAARSVRQGSPEFSDLLALRIAKQHGCEKLLTFDRQMARAEHAELLES